jgi:hypothetical protein
MIYPASFSDTESGKPVVYMGTWTATLKKTSGHLVFTGSLRVDRPLIVSLWASGVDRQEAAVADRRLRVNLSHWLVAKLTTSKVRFPEIRSFTYNRGHAS